MHLDEFTLLRYAARDLAASERASADEHLSACRSCEKVLVDMRRVDAELSALAAAGELGEGLPVTDPFFGRPESSARGGPPASPEGALRASERGAREADELLAAMRSAKAPDLLAALDLRDASHRYRLLYALQQAGKDISRDPVATLALADRVLALLTGSLPPRESGGEAEACVPGSALLGQAHFLAAHAHLWTAAYESARAHAESAYAQFGRTGDPVSLAEVELAESQRRSFTGAAASALPLARRAAATFESLGLEDLLARAWMCEGLALSYLERDEDSLEYFRRALPVFERLGLWSNFTGALANMATSLVRLGRLDVARREYARCLRRVSRTAHRSHLAYLRKGLASVLLEAGRFRSAATSFAQAARLFGQLGLHADALVTSLFEIESWARAGDLPRATHRLELFRREAARRGALDPAVVAEIERALAGEHADLPRMAQLREEAERAVLERLPRSG